MNKRNLQRELDEIIKANEASGIRPRLLLHVCCAPCSSYCLEYLRKYFEITVYFSNSNIDDETEYRHRRDESRRFTEAFSETGPAVSWVEGEYAPEHFHYLTTGFEDEPEGGARCTICFAMRLREAAAYAGEHHFDYFTTSLSISPLKDAGKLCNIGETAGNAFDVRYLPSDFKKKDGYKRSIELSKEYQLYRQNYCGCSFSRSMNVTVSN